MREEILERWRQELIDPTIHAYVSTDDSGALTGFATTRRDELLHFGTAVRLWSSGLATSLHDFAIEDLQRTNAGRRHPFYRLRVFEENHRARRFYEKLGWAATDIRTKSSFEPHPCLLEYRFNR